MPRFIVERDLPGAGQMTDEQLHDISQKSCDVLMEMGPEIQWLNSYVTNDKVYCLYIAPNKDLVYEHSKRGGFPANLVSEVKNVIDPTTADQVKATAFA